MIRIEGYAVVGDDDRISDCTGSMPDSLRHDAEWRYFQAGLDAADVTVLGRQSHEVTPNPRQRRRLVLTRSVTHVERRSDAVFWNPAGAPLLQALDAFECPIDHLAVAGGQGIFDFFLTGPHRYTCFHLSRIAGVSLPGGTAVFARTQQDGCTAAQVLESSGFRETPRQELAPNVHVDRWTPVGP